MTAPSFALLLLTSAGCEQSTIPVAGPVDLNVGISGDSTEQISLRATAVNRGKLPLDYREEQCGTSVQFPVSVRIVSPAGEPLHELNPRDRVHGCRTVAATLPGRSAVERLLVLGGVLYNDQDRSVAMPNGQYTITFSFVRLLNETGSKVETTTQTVMVTWRGS